MNTMSREASRMLTSCPCARNSLFLSRSLSSPNVDFLSSATKCLAIGIDRHYIQNPVTVRSLTVCSSEKREPSVHFVGIGGSGMSSLATVAYKQGWSVSGSDQQNSKRLSVLVDMGITARVGHDGSWIKDRAPYLDAVVVSSAVPRSNEEVKAAADMGIRIYSRRDWLHKITESKKVVAVAGTHGKSTTSAMLALALQSIGHEVTAVTGADVKQFPGGLNAVVGSSPYFVLEADEYDGCFLGVSPELSVILNVEWDHVDMFPDEASVRDIFCQFAVRTKPQGALVVFGDSAGSKSIADYVVASGQGGLESGRLLTTYGLEERNDWQAAMLAPNSQGGTDFVAVWRGRPLCRVSLTFPGLHMVLNSLAVIASAVIVSTPMRADGDASCLASMRQIAEKVASTLAQFEGIERRFEVVGQCNGVTVLDDYAHHPSEIRATLQATRQKYNNRPIWAIFQPHTHSRLTRLFHDFVPAFSAANRVIISEVYAAREEAVNGGEATMDGQDLASSIIGPPAIYLPSQEQILSRLSWEYDAYRASNWMSEGDIVVLILGAGDITSLGPKIMHLLISKS